MTDHNTLVFALCVAAFVIGWNLYGSRR